MPKNFNWFYPILWFWPEMVAKMSDALARLGGAQAAYRLSSVRQYLGIDLRPGMQENQNVL